MPITKSIAWVAISVCLSGCYTVKWARGTEFPKLDGLDASNPTVSRQFRADDGELVEVSASDKFKISASESRLLDTSFNTLTVRDGLVVGEMSLSGAFLRLPVADIDRFGVERLHKGKTAAALVATVFGSFFVFRYGYILLALAMCAGSSCSFD